MEEFGGFHEGNTLRGNPPWVQAHGAGGVGLQSAPTQREQAFRKSLKRRTVTQLSYSTNADSASDRQLDGVAIDHDVLHFFPGSHEFGWQCLAGRGPFHHVFCSVRKTVQGQ